MSRTVRVELVDVAAWPNLEAALWSAARGKRCRPDVARFLTQGQNALQSVRDALLQGRLPMGQLSSFAIRDPKPRIIHAAPFEDRVAHHALIRLLEPRLEQALVPTSCACRPGLGLHAALSQALAQSRRWPWVLKLDVRHCFPSIPHLGLLALLSRRMRGSAWALVEGIVGAHNTQPAGQPARGLPIGSLTSQHFANQYLGELDRAALAHPACRAHVRYMDDVLLWCESSNAAQRLRDELMTWLPTSLGLSFKPAVIQRVRAGTSFCGFGIFPGGVRMGRRRQRAWRAEWARQRQAMGEPGVDEAWLQLRAEVLRGLACGAEATSLGWRRRLLAAGGAFDDVCSERASPPTNGPQAGAARRQLEQQRQELPFRQPQRERAG